MSRALCCVILFYHEIFSNVIIFFLASSMLGDFIFTKTQFSYTVPLSQDLIFSKLLLFFTYLTTINSLFFSRNKYIFSILKKIKDILWDKSNSVFLVTSSSKKPWGISMKILFFIVVKFFRAISLAA